MNVTAGQQPLTPMGSHSGFFIDPVKLGQLREGAAPGSQKLARLFEELNTCYQHDCYFAIAMLTRAVLDCVPTCFGMKTFAEVVNNYSWGRSKRDAMDHLQNSARKIADLHLHGGGAEDVLPSQAQVNFGPSLDLLLAEVLKTRSGRDAAAEPSS